MAQGLGRVEMAAGFASLNTALQDGMTAAGLPPRFQGAHFYRQAAQEAEDAVADGGGEGLGVAGDVGGGFLGAGRAHFLGLGALVARVAHLLPLVEQAGIHLADHGAQVEFHFAHRVVLGGVGHGLREDLVDAVQVPQQDAFGALQFVVADVIGEGAERLEHLARDGLGPDVLLADPRMLVGKGVEGGVDELAVRLRVFELLQLLHPLVVFDARPSSSRPSSGSSACRAACGG